MNYRSYNYETLEGEITTKEEGLKVAEVISTPCSLVERCEILLGDFMQHYFFNPKNLYFELENKKETVMAKIKTLHEMLQTASQMLCECKEYCQTFIKKA